MRVALGSAHGAPGVSTLALALATARARRGEDVLLLEADRSGGSLAAALGVPAEPGLVHLAAGELAGAGGEGGGLCRLEDRLDAVFAPPSPGQTAAALELARPALTQLLDATPAAVLDCGRLGCGPAHPLLEACDLLVWLARPTLAGLAGLAAALEETHPAGLPAAVALAEPAAPTEATHPAAEVAELLRGRAVLVASLPFDPAGVRTQLAGGRRRTRLAAAAAGMLTALDRLSAAARPAPAAVAAVGSP